MEPKEVLEKAKSILERGWCQNQNKDYAGNYCMLGAMRKVDGLLHSRCGPRNFVLRAIAKVTKKGINDTYIVTYNDAPKRTKEQVLKVMDLAIEMAGKSGS